MESGYKTRFSIEIGLLSKLLETRDLRTIRDYQIRSSFFTGENRRIFKYITNSVLETGEFPTIRTLERKFQNFRYETHEVDGDVVVGTEENLLFWCVEIRNKNTHNLLAENVEKIAELLNNGDTEAAKNLYESGFFKLENEISIHERTVLTDGVEDRINRYLERKANLGIVGIPTGIHDLDLILRGLVDDTLTTLIAKTGVGKSWILVIIGAYAMLNNYKVMVFVTEMSRDLMEDRFDAVLFGYLYEGFSYNKFKSGTLEPEVEEQFFNFLREDVPRLERLVIEDAPDIASVISGVQREKPDLVMVDSAYLMDDGQKTDSDWLRVTHITRALKKDVAKRFHVPVFINSQADKTTSKKTGPSMDNISFAQTIGQDSDNILAAYRDDVMYMDNEMGLRVLKNREGTLGKAVINWDFKKMNFSSIYSEREDSEEVDSVVDMSDNIIGVDD